MLHAVFDASSVEIEGTAHDLRQLSLKIKGCANFDQMPLTAPADHNDKGFSYLNQLVLIVDSGPLVISISDRQLSLSGAKEKLDLLSDSVDWLVNRDNLQDKKIRDHIHVEFYPGHFFLSEHALPLVLIRQD